jgi:hypothetical protein
MSASEQARADAIERALVALLDELPPIIGALNARRGWRLIRRVREAQAALRLRAVPGLRGNR